MANQECVEPSMKRVKIEKELFFTGSKLRCVNQSFPNNSWCGSLYNGYWQNSEYINVDVVVRRIQETDCRENWKNILDRHLANSLSHKNVLNIIGYEEDIYHWRYFALERFDATLEQYCNGEYTGPMPCKAIALFQISDGLNYLHDKGLVHGQLNPNSILIVRQSESVLIKISDFLYGGPHKEENLDCLSHPKYWMLPYFCPTNSNEHDVPKNTFALTVYGDVFAAGCLFFYCLSRGLHPFGNIKEILVNIAKYQPVNLKELDENHFAYQSIKDMVGEPSKNGTQYLRIAAANFKDVPPYNFKEILRPVSEINVDGFLLVRFHPTLPVLACFKGNKITVFSASNGSVPFSSWKECELKFEGQHRRKLVTLKWNHDGELLAAGFEDGCVAVWQYPSGEIVFKVTQHLEKVVAIYWSPSKHEFFATLNRKKDQLFLWNSYPNNQQKTHFDTIESDGIVSSVVWRTNQQIIVGCDDCTISVFELDETESDLLLVKQFADKGKIKYLFWNEATQYLASVNCDNLMSIWSLDSNEAIHSAMLDSTCCCLALCPNANKSDGIEKARKSKKHFNFACGLKNGSIVIWNPFEETKSPLILEKHSASVNRLSFSHDGKFLASTSKNEIIIWSTESCSPVFKGESNGNKIFSWLTAVTNAEPAYKLALSSRSKTIRVIEIADTEIDIYDQKNN